MTLFQENLLKGIAYSMVIGSLCVSSSWGMKEGEGTKIQISSKIINEPINIPGEDDYHQGMKYLKQGNKEKALEYFYKAEKQNHVEAQYTLGSLYDGCQVYEAAMKYYLLAAKQNYPEAQTSIGRLYEKGLGVEKNYIEAMKWYLLAAKQNDDDAQDYIGRLYEKGLGVEKNYEEAIKWYLLGKENAPFKYIKKSYDDKINSLKQLL